MRTAGDVIDRLRQVLGVDTDADLGRAIGVKKNTISTWRTRGSKPFALCELVAAERGVSLDWLLAGEGEMYRGGGDAPGEDRPAAHPELTAEQRRIEALLAVLAQLEPGSRDTVLTDCFTRAADAQQLDALREAVRDLEAWRGKKAG